MATGLTIGGQNISSDYQDFTIDVPLSPVGVAPTATITLTNEVDVTAGDNVTIDIDGSRAFDGIALSGGRKSAGGGRRLEAVHPAERLFTERIDVTINVESAADDEAVLETALTNADRGSDFSLDFAGTPTDLEDTYEVENRTVKRVFRDMMDRTNRVWWVEPGVNTIHVEPRGGRGQWKDLDTQADAARLEEFDEGSVDSVSNDVTVVGTGAERVEANATDQTSIDTYGRQSKPAVNVSYITTQSEAAAMANELLIPDPLAEGTLLVGQNVGDVVSPLVNQTVAVTDDALNVDESGLVIEEQTIQQGRAELRIGEGSGVNLSRVNRNSKSNTDTTESGTVYDTERLSDLAVTETKISDNAVSTPKLIAEAVVASKIAADTITANEVAADTLTANEIDTLDLDTGQLTIGANTDVQFEFEVQTVNDDDIPVFTPSTDRNGFLGLPGSQFSQLWVTSVDTGYDNTGDIGSSNNAYAEMHAHNFITASPDAIDGVDCDSLCDIDWYENPPEEVRQRARDIGETDEEIPEGRDHTPVELGTMANYLLEACKSLADEKADLEKRVDDLEARVAALEE